MKPESNPTRLIESSDFSEVLAKASQHRWSEKKLTEQGRILASGIAALTTAGGASSAASALKLGPLAKPTVAIVAIGLAGTGIYLTTGNESASEITPPVEETTAQPIHTPEPPDVELIAPPTPTSQAPKPPRKQRDRRTAKRLVKNKNTTLSLQLALIRKAKAAAKRSDYSDALHQLDSFRSRYPNGSLLVEAQILRLEYLATLSRNQDGLELAAQLLSQPISLTKKAQILRLQGDLFLKTGDCSRANTAFRRAIGFGLPDSEVELAQRGLKKCNDS